MQYLPTPYANKIWLPLALIKTAIAENWLDTLIYYVWLKKVFVKPVFYNYSLRKLSAHLGCSPTTIGHHINILCQKGLAWRDGTNLHLKSTNNLYKADNFIVPVGISYNKAQQRDLLRFTLHKRNFHQQFRTYCSKSEILKLLQGKFHGYTRVKRVLKKAKNYPAIDKLESSMQNVLTLSNAKFGAIANRSKSTGLKIQKSFNALNLISSYARSVLFEAKYTTKREFYGIFRGPDIYLTHSGYVFKRLTNGLSLVSEV